jgi:hypothetical protein
LPNARKEQNVYQFQVYSIHTAINALLHFQDGAPAYITKYWARFVSSMHEWIRVYEDEERILRADHVLQFYGKALTLKRLHYQSF